MSGADCSSPGRYLRYKCPVPAHTSRVHSVLCHNTASTSRCQIDASLRRIVIVERWRPGMEVSVTEGEGWGLREGGCGNVPVVNYMADSHIPSDGFAADGCRTSAAWLINPLTHIKGMHPGTAFWIISVSCFICSVWFDVVCVHAAGWYCGWFCTCRPSLTV